MKAKISIICYLRRNEIFGLLFDIGVFGKFLFLINLTDKSDKCQVVQNPNISHLLNLVFD